MNIEEKEHIKSKIDDAIKKHYDKIHKKLYTVELSLTVTISEEIECDIGSIKIKKVKD